MTLENPPAIGMVAEVGEIFLGGFSGLQKLDDNRYLTLTDRGPNGPLIDFKKNGEEFRPFLISSYYPKIIEFKINKNKIEIIKTTDIATTGLPNIPNVDESPSTPRGTPLKHNPLGLDSEGIVLRSDSTYWIVEEYAPSLYQISNDGKILSRFIPKNSHSKRIGKPVLSPALNKRRANRGFEGITELNGLLYIVLQSPIDKKSKLVPIIEFDPELKKQTGLFLYELDQQSDKIGDLTNDGQEIFVLEQNGKTGKEAYRKIYSVKTDSSLNVIDTTGIDSFNGDSLAKKLQYDLNHEELNSEEKIEGIAYLNHNQLALVADNDFGLGFLFDEKTGKIGKMLNNPTFFYLVEKK